MATSDDTFQIYTPENVQFGYQIAGIGSRFIAALIDTALITLLQAAAILAILFAISFLNLITLGEQGNAWALAVAGLIMFGFLWGYYIFFEALWNGQTPGKRLARLRVIRSDGLPIGFTESAIRNLVRLVDFLPAYYGVGVVAMFVDERARRLGDLAAGTLVVHDRGALSLQSLEQEQASLDGALMSAETNGGWPAELPVENLCAEDLRQAEEFIRRRADLANRNHLAYQVADRLRKRMGIEVVFVGENDPENFILQVLRLRKKQIGQKPPTYKF